MIVPAINQLQHVMAFHRRPPGAFVKLLGERRFAATICRAQNIIRPSLRLDHPIATDTAIRSDQTASNENIDASAETSRSISAIECNGVGVMRNRSHPLGTVG